MFGFGLAEFSARRTLAQLPHRSGCPVLVATLAVPGLIAEIDQHAAAVRDILALGVDGGSAVGVVLLAGYARGLIDQARDMGWRFGEPPVPAGWGTVGLLTARPLGVCGRARRADSPRRPAELAGIEF